jgi:hypothetical protein
VKAVFDFEGKKGKKWTVRIDGSTQEIDTIKANSRFNHRVVLHRKWRDEEGNREEDITTLGEFSNIDTAEPIGAYWSFRYESQIEVEEWEKQVTKRVAEITAELARFIAPNPPQVEEAFFQAHCVFMSKAGSGKTNGMRWRLKELLKRWQRGECSLIIMEPKGNLIRQILNLKGVYKERERVNVIDPEDLGSGVAVNLFDRGSGSDRDRNTSLAMAKYVLNTLAMSLTPSHRQILEACAQLLFVIDEEPHMGTLMEVLRSGASSYSEHFRKLTRATQDFFEYQYHEKKLQARKDELIGRLNNVLGQPTFDRLLHQKKTTFDLFEAMNNASLVLINANEGFLGFGEDTKLYGKFWSAMIYKAGIARYNLKTEFMPCWVCIDEAQEYVTDDEMFAAGLDLLREAKVSSIFAMHFLEQISSLRVRLSIETNTAAKFRALPETDYHFECQTPKEKQIIKFPLVDFRKFPQATKEEVEELRAISRKKFGTIIEQEPPLSGRKKRSWRS